SGARSRAAAPDPARARPGNAARSSRRLGTVVTNTHEKRTALSLVDRAGIPRTLFWGYAGLLLFMIGDGVETSYLPVFFKTDMGFPEASVGAVFTVYGITAALGSFLS